MPFTFVDDEVFGTYIDITEVDDPWAELLKVVLANGQEIYFEVADPTVITSWRAMSKLVGVNLEKSDISVFQEMVDGMKADGVSADVVELQALLKRNFQPIRARFAAVPPDNPIKAKLMPMRGGSLTLGVMGMPMGPLLGAKLMADVILSGGPIVEMESIIDMAYGDSRRPDPNNPHIKAQLEVDRLTIASRKAAKSDG